MRIKKEAFQNFIIYFYFIISFLPTFLVNLCVFKKIQFQYNDVVLFIICNLSTSVGIPAAVLSAAPFSEQTLMKSAIDKCRPIVTCMIRIHLEFQDGIKATKLKQHKIRK